MDAYSTKIRQAKLLTRCALHLTQAIGFRFKVMAIEFNRLFCAATKRARKKAGYTQAQMADILDIPRNTYKGYETRSPLPHDLLMRFCAHTGTSLAEMLDVEYLRRLQNRP